MHYQSRKEWISTDREQYNQYLISTISINIIDNRVAGGTKTPEGRAKNMCVVFRANPIMYHLTADCLFVCSYNCRTIASDADLRTLLLRSRQIKYDVIAIQETKGRTETIRKTDHNELLIVGAKVDGKNVGGVGFLVNQAVVHLVDSHKIVPYPLSRDMRYPLSRDMRPSSAATDEEREEFYQLLEDTVQNERSYYKYVLARTTTAIGDSGLTSNSRNENGERLLDLL
ncbi:hypothetical protein COOONC_05507 [Cooperia oncophora]